MAINYKPTDKCTAVQYTRISLDTVEEVETERSYKIIIWKIYLYRQYRQNVRVCVCKLCKVHVLTVRQYEDEEILFKLNYISCQCHHCINNQFSSVLSFLELVWVRWAAGQIQTHSSAPGSISSCLYDSMFYVFGSAIFINTELSQAAESGLFRNVKYSSASEMFGSSFSLLFYSTGSSGARSSLSDAEAVMDILMKRWEDVQRDSILGMNVFLRPD